MNEKPWVVETFLDERNIFAWGKFSWWNKNLGLWKKAYLIKQNSLLVENFLNKGKILACGEKFLDNEKIFACGKLPWWQKNFCLWKTFFMKENSWLVEKLFYCGKIIALSLLKMNLSNKTNASVGTSKITISKPGVKT